MDYWFGNGWLAHRLTGLRATGVLMHLCNDGQWNTIVMNCIAWAFVIIAGGQGVSGVRGIKRADYCSSSPQ
jgi:hypothetical protein